MRTGYKKQNADVADLTHSLGRFGTRTEMAGNRDGDGEIERW